ncbi:MAG: hypothetical protein NVSMB38_46220 [Ktedonobacteraceae bacterium]
MDVINFILDPKNDFLGQTAAYLQICGISILGAVLIGVALGAAVSRNSFLAFIAVNLSGFARAIPVIATLIVFVPFFGLGLKPTLIALIIIGIPPVLLNTYTGIWVGYNEHLPLSVSGTRGMQRSLKCRGHRSLKCRGHRSLKCRGHRSLKCRGSKGA